MKPNPATTKPWLSARIKFSLFTLLGLPLLISLGVWQLYRAAEKDQIEAHYQEQHSLPPAELDTTTLDQVEDYRRVLAQGEFDSDHTWLLDNKQRHGRVGFEVVSPFRLHSGEVILVNRGWLPGNDDRLQLPAIPRVSGEVTLFGELVSASSHPMLDAESLTEEWPRLVMTIDPNAMAAQLGTPLATRYLRLDEASPGTLVADWQQIPVSAAKHRGYAVQWFAMALALFIWFIVANTNLLHTWRRR